MPRVGADHFISGEPGGAPTRCDVLTESVRSQRKTRLSGDGNEPCELSLCRDSGMSGQTIPAGIEFVGAVSLLGISQDLRSDESGRDTDQSRAGAADSSPGGVAGGEETYQTQGTGDDDAVGASGVLSESCLELRFCVRSDWGRSPAQVFDGGG